jgi:hypothetical protein
MSAPTLARGIAIGRLGFGLGLLVAPRRLSEPWLGADAALPATAVALRGLAARDLALGAGTLASRPEHLRLWVVASMIGDLADLTATLAAGDHLPRNGRIGVGALAAAAVALGALAQAGLARE